MTDYALTEPPDAKSVSEPVELDENGARDGLAGETARDERGKQRNCLMCGEPLADGERKVHRGACATKRENEMQNRRRQRRRRWISD